MALVPHRLTLAEYTTLSVLAAGGGLSNAQLARRALITPQAMNEVLARLEVRRLVKRHPAATGRARPAALTPAGRALLRQADASAAAVERELLGGLGAADRSRLVELLEVISGNLI